MVRAIKTTNTTSKPTVRKNKGESKDKSTERTTDKIIDKLDGNQLVNLAGSIVELGKSIMVFATEKERTEQIKITAHVRMYEIENEDRESERHHHIEISKIANDEKNSNNSHIEAMKILNIKEDKIFNVFDLKDRAMKMLEKKEISVDDFQKVMCTINEEKNED